MPSSAGNARAAQTGWQLLGFVLRAETWESGHLGTEKMGKRRPLCDDRGGSGRQELTGGSAVKAEHLSCGLGGARTTPGTMRWLLPRHKGQPTRVLWLLQFVPRVLPAGESTARNILLFAMVLGQQQGSAPSPPRAAVPSSPAG